MKIKYNVNTVAFSTLCRGPVRLWLACLLSMVILLGAAGCNEQAKKTVPFTFGAAADVQYGDKDTAGARNYRKSIESLESCVADFNSRELAFVIQLGDLVDGGSGVAADYDNILSVYNRIRTDKYHVLGNHDFTGIARTAVLKKLGMTEAYYDFEKFGWRFVVLDPMELSIAGGWPESSENLRLGRRIYEELQKKKAPNAVPWCGALGADQLQWLKSVLADADSKKQKVVVFAHHALMPENNGHNIWNAEDVVEILESCDGMVAYINGHRHPGGYMERNGIHYITIEGIVEAPKENAYAFVKVSDDGIEIEGVGKTPDRNLAIRERAK